MIIHGVNRFTSAKAQNLLTIFVIHFSFCQKGWPHSFSVHCTKFCAMFHFPNSGLCLDKHNGTSISLGSEISTRIAVTDKICDNCNLMGHFYKYSNFRCFTINDDNNKPFSLFILEKCNVSGTECNNENDCWFGKRYSWKTGTSALQILEPRIHTFDRGC